MLGRFFKKPKIKKTPLSLTITCQIFRFLGSTLHLLQEASWGCGACLQAGSGWIPSWHFQMVRACSGDKDSGGDSGTARAVLKLPS